MPALFAFFDDFDRYWVFSNPPKDAANLWSRYHSTREIETIAFVAKAVELPAASREWLIVACICAAQSGRRFYGEAADRIAHSLGRPSSDVDDWGYDEGAFYPGGDA